MRRPSPPAVQLKKALRISLWRKWRPVDSNSRVLIICATKSFKNTSTCPTKKQLGKQVSRLSSKRTISISNCSKFTRSFWYSNVRRSAQQTSYRKLRSRLQLSHVRRILLCKLLSRRKPQKCHCNLFLHWIVRHQTAKNLNSPRTFKHRINTHQSNSSNMWFQAKGSAALTDLKLDTPSPLLGIK